MKEPFNAYCVEISDCRAFGPFKTVLGCPAGIWTPLEKTAKKEIIPCDTNYKRSNKRLKKHWLKKTGMNYVRKTIKKSLWKIIFTITCLRGSEYIVHQAKLYSCIPRLECTKIASTWFFSILKKFSLIEFW